LRDECVVANFVESLDGRVALPDVPRSNRLIADASEADHFVMALLRASADVVVVGSGTLRASPSAAWNAAAAFPTLADAFAELRRRLGLQPEPDFAVIARTPLPRDLRRMPIVLDRGLEAAFAELRSRGYRRILSEGGPTLFGSLLDVGLLDELFLTLSPVVAGRGLSLVEGLPLLPDRRVAGSLIGARRSESHLFLRYAFSSA
jgi:riboflavin biosynthesis pyrimidine reductase